MPYNTLTDPWRRIEYGVKHPTPHCDQTQFTPGWYQFTFPEAPYATIPTTSPKPEHVRSDMQSCGTYTVSWMEGSLPAIGQPPQSVNIHFAFQSNEKHASVTAKVVACPAAGGHTVYRYELPAVTACAAAYCAL